jgi:hypothetical protein
VNGSKRGEEKMNENSLTEGKSYFKVQDGKRVDLGVYKNFYVSRRNGCSIYDEPYYVFEKDGMEHMESMLDLRYYKMTLYDAESSYLNRLNNNEIAAFSKEYEPFIDKGVVPEAAVITKEMERWSSVVKMNAEEYNKVVQKYSDPSPKHKTTSWLDDDYEKDHKYIYQIRTAKQTVENDNKLIYRYLACLKLGIFKAEDNGKFVNVGDDKNIYFGSTEAEAAKYVRNCRVFQIHM